MTLTRTFSCDHVGYLWQCNSIKSISVIKSIVANLFCTLIYRNVSVDSDGLITPLLMLFTDRLVFFADRTRQCNLRLPHKVINVMFWFLKCKSSREDISIRIFYRYL